MRKINVFIPVYIGDYMRDAGHLKALEHGAYLMLLFHAWTHANKIATDSLADVARCTPEQWERVRPKLEGFFQVRGGFWTNRKTRKVLAQWGAKKDKASAKASRAARARWEKVNAPSIGQALHKECPSSSSSNKNPPKAPPGVFDGFDDFEKAWSTYPRRIGDPKDQALAVYTYITVKDRPRFLAAVRAYAATKPTRIFYFKTFIASKWVNYAPAATVAIEPRVASRDWGDDHPQWAQVKLLAGPHRWGHFFADAVFDDDADSLIVSGPFSKSKIDEQFTDAIAAAFGKRRIKIIVKKGKP